MNIHRYGVPLAAKFRSWKRFQPDCNRLEAGSAEWYERIRILKAANNHIGWVEDHGNPEFIEPGSADWYRLISLHKVLMGSA